MSGQGAPSPAGRASLPLMRPTNQSLSGHQQSGPAMANQAALSATTTTTTTTTTLSGGVQMRTAASGIAKTSRLGLVRPSSGYFSYSTHRKHPDSDNESVNSLSSSSASSRGSLYRVDSQSIANNVQQPHLPVASATRTNSIEDVSGAAGAGGGGVSMLTKLNGTSHESQTTIGGPVSLQPTTGLKQPTAIAGTGAAKPSGLRPPSAIRPPSVRSGLPRPTSYIRR
ncbi:AGAP005607-PA-like protein [Anopheles sinensis]|uniref:AGAP005607-PA-like protein n=1 Tax=Anopheles sinensis TaxID=74873 RepID=A0A084VC89_ANOSI|nr:AGAP005607-PA-like protein [Anopheles sinensis]